MEMLHKQLELFNGLLQSGITNIDTGWLHVDIPSEMWEATPTGSGVLYLLQQGADTITKLWHSCMSTLLLREVKLTHNRAACQTLPCFIRRWYWPIKESHIRHSRAFQGGDIYPYRVACQALQEATMAATMSGPPVLGSGTTLTYTPTLLIFGAAVDPQIGHHLQ